MCTESTESSGRSLSGLVWDLRFCVFHSLIIMQAWLVLCEESMQCRTFLGFADLVLLTNWAWKDAYVRTYICMYMYVLGELC